jgi:hypothetical protein
MAYFSLTTLATLLRPPTIVGTDPTGTDSSTTTYPFSGSTSSAVGTNSTVVSPFTGEAINTNFYNLFVNAIDNTTRISNIESRSIISGSIAIGYVTYNGLNEYAGEFYSGIPLSLFSGPTTPYSNLYSTAHTFNCSASSTFALGSTSPLGFTVAVGNSIVYNAGTTTINVSNSNFRTITFNDASPANGSPFSTTTALLAYMNNRLRYNTNDTSMSFRLYGANVPSFNLTLSYPATFILGINDSKYAGNTTICTVGAGLYTTMLSFTQAFEAALNSGASALGFNSPFTTTGNASNIIVTAVSNDRTSNGIYEFYLGLNSADPNSSTTANSILGPNFLGLIASGSNAGNYAETYDLTSCFTFGVTGTGPYIFTINGVGASIALAFQDAASNGIFSAYFGTVATAPGGVPGPTSGYWTHTRSPSSLGATTVLNYGGTFNVNNFTCNNLTVGGNITYAGVVSFSGTQTFSNITATGNLTITGTTSTVGSFDAGTSYPPSTLTRLNYNGTLYAAQFVGRSIGLQLSTYIYYTPQNASVPLGYFAYNDTTAVPTNGLGGTASNVVFSTTNTSVLFGSYDMRLTYGGASSLGQGVSYDFSIDYGMTTQVFQISFLFNTYNFTSGDVMIYLYDKANLNFIPLSTQSVLATSGSPSMFLATFLPSSSSQYRLLFHCATGWNGTGEYFQFNAVSVTPQNLLNTTSSMINGWTQYTNGGANGVLQLGATVTPPTFGSTGTFYDYIAQWSRNGSDMELSYHMVINAVGNNNAGSGDYLFPLPSGLTIDWTKIAPSASYSNPIQIQGEGRVFFSGNYYIAHAYVVPSVSLSSFKLYYSTSATAEAICGSATTGLTTASLEFHYNVRLPIAQWNVPTNLSTDYQEYSYNSSANATTDTTSFAYGANGTLIYGYSPSSLTSIQKYVQFQKTLTNRDDYILEFMNPAVSTSSWLTPDQLGIGYYTNGTTAYGVTVTTINSTTLSVNFFSAASPTVLWSSITTWYWRLRKRSQGNTAEQPPVIRAEYAIVSSTIPTSGNVVNFDTLVEDTHTSVLPGIGWKFTAPQPGVYSVETNIGLATAKAFAAGETWLLYLYKNGTYFSTINSWTSTAVLASTPNIFVLGGNKTIRLRAGDYVQVVVSYSNTSGTFLQGLTTPGAPRITIERIGS